MIANAPKDTGPVGRREAEAGAILLESIRRGVPGMAPAADALFALGCQPGVWHPTVEALAATFRRPPGTVRSAWARAARRHGLADEPLARPSALLAHCWLVRCAAVLEDPEISLGRAAVLMGAPSPQGFMRTIQLRTGEAPADWRRGRTGIGTAATFLTELLSLRGMLEDVHVFRRHPIVTLRTG